MNVKNEERLIYESAQRSAEHYNSMIWQVFAIGVALSLWILYKTFEFKENLKDIRKEKVQTNFKGKQLMKLKDN